MKRRPWTTEDVDIALMMSKTSKVSTNTAEQILPSQRLWRSLVRVTDFCDVTGYVWFCIPSWDARKTVKLHKSDLPWWLHKFIDVDKRFHVEVNTGTLDEADLRFVNWELY